MSEMVFSQYFHIIRNSVDAAAQVLHSRLRLRLTLHPLTKSVEHDGDIRSNGYTDDWMSFEKSSNGLVGEKDGNDG